MTNKDHQHSAEPLEQKIDRLQHHAWIGDPAQRMGELHAVIATLWAKVQATRKPVTINFEPQRQRNAAPKLLATLESVAALRCKWRSQDEAETIDSIEYMDGLDSLDIDAVIADAKAAGIQPEPSDPTNVTTEMYDTLSYVAEMLSGLKPDFLRNIGLDVALEKTSAAMDAYETKAQAGCSPGHPQSTVPLMSVANNEYVSSTEIVPGVFLDPSVAVYIADRQGEVVSWNHEEIVADPSGFTAAVAAVAIATKYGPSAVRENIQTGGAVLARLAEPPRFAIEHNPAQNRDRLYVLVDDKFGVAIIRTDEGVVVDVYPKNGFETIASTYAFDSDAEESDDALTKPTETQGASRA